MLRSFGHLMNQYSAAYYGYMWAEVISADMFATRFEADCMALTLTVPSPSPNPNPNP